MLIPGPEILEERGMDGGGFISGEIVGSRFWFLVNHRRDNIFESLDHTKIRFHAQMLIHGGQIIGSCLPFVLVCQIMVLVDTWVFRLMLFFSICFCFC